MIRAEPRFEAPPDLEPRIIYLNPTEEEGWGYEAPPLGHVWGSMSRWQVEVVPEGENEWLWEEGKWRAFVTEFEDDFFWQFEDYLEKYLYDPPQNPFRPYRYAELWRDVLGVANGDLDLVARWLDLYGHGEIPQEKERAPRNQGEKGSGERRFSDRQRDRMATEEKAFYVQSVERTVGAFDHRGKWDRDRVVWEVVIQGTQTGRGVLPLPGGNRQRDHQLQWLLERTLEGPFEVPLCLKWLNLPKGRRMVTLHRTEVRPDPPTLEVMKHGQS